MVGGPLSTFRSCAFSMSWSSRNLWVLFCTDPDLSPHESTADRLPVQEGLG